jgi:phosphate transport system substrate-binding protein
MPVRRPAAVVSAACAAALLALPASTAFAKTTISMSGSTSVAPLAGKLAKGFLKDKGKVAAFRLSQGGSDIGVSDVAHGRVTIGNSSRDPLPTDPGGLVFNRIARDAICVATHPSNKLTNIDQETIQAIFTGRVRNWSDVPGSGRTGSIAVIVRTAASGTQDAFQNIFLGQSLRVTPSASTKSSNGLVQQSIKTNPNAIGYVDFNFIGGLNVLAYKGVACTLRNAKSASYGGVRNFWMVTRGKPKGMAGTFIKWIQKSSAARKIVASNWVPLR